MKKLKHFAETHPGLAAVLLVTAACVPALQQIYMTYR